MSFSREVRGFAGGSRDDFRETRRRGDILPPYVRGGRYLLGAAANLFVFLCLLTFGPFFSRSREVRGKGGGHD